MKSFKIFVAIFLTFSLMLQAAIQQLVPLIVSKIPHALPAFTQGLAMDGDDLYESTGLYGESSLRRIDLLTGKVLQYLPLSSEIFAEGIAVFPQQIVLLTWKEKKAFIYDKTSFKLQNTFSYGGEGWGLCKEAEAIWMSNGTPILMKRDVKTFRPLKHLVVKWKGKPLPYLNDLECTERALYANVFLKNWIVRIDKTTGEVTGIVDASRLLSAEEKKKLDPSSEVLNGIAFRPQTGTFFLTGKNWPWIFEVRFISKHRSK